MLNPSLIIRNANKNHVRHHLTLVELANINKSTNNKCLDSVCGEKRNLFMLLMGLQTATATMENNVEFL